MRNLTSEELMKIYQKETPEKAYMAFEELSLRYSERVYSFIKKKNVSQVDAEDILQKVFIKMHESKHLFDSHFKFEQWIFVIARTTVIDFLRKEKRELKKIEKLVFGKNSSAEEITDPVDLDFFHHLENDERKLLEMKYIDQLSYMEISKKLNRSEVSLRKVVSRLILRVRKEII